MKIRIIVALLLLAGNVRVQAMDVEPVITHNVTVIPNPSPGQCKSSWNGQIAAGQQTTYSGAGDQTGNYKSGYFVLLTLRGRSEFRWMCL